jgi:DNA-binding SARP family transcriptional activator
MVKVQLFGYFTITALDGDVVFPTQKSRALAAYLFWQQGKWVRRDKLRGMLWGEFDEERAKSNLRVALHYSRKAFKEAGVPDDLLETRRDAVRVVAGDCLLDVRAFEEKTRQGFRKDVVDIKLLMDAVSIYQGKFLEGMDDEWCLAERRRLSDTYIKILKALVDHLKSSGLYEAAISYAHRWLAADELDEGAHRALISLYAAMGQSERAVEQYIQCHDLLKAELGILPGETTVCLMKEIGLDPGERIDARLEGNDESQYGHKRPPKIQLSDDPLRNARFLLIYGEGKASRGDVEEGVAALKESLGIYERIGDAAQQAKARLILGQVIFWASIPQKREAENALRYVTPALAYYRENGPAADLVRAIELAAEAYWSWGKNDEAIRLAQEGLDLIPATGDRESESRLAMIKGVALRESFRLKEAQAAFDHAMLFLPSLSNNWDTLWIIVQRGILAGIIGDLRDAEHFLRESIAISQSIVTSPPKVKLAEFMARTVLAGILHYQNRGRDDIESILPPAGASKYNLEPSSYLVSLFIPSEHYTDVLEGLDGWLRSRFYELPPVQLAGTVRKVVEELLAAGLDTKASRWAAAGVHLARSRNCPQASALFYCYRAMIHTRQGRLHAAGTCRRRAEKYMDDADKWTRAWIVRIDGLISMMQDNLKDAEYKLSKSMRMFRKMGDNLNAGRVGADLAQVKNRISGH